MSLLPDSIKVEANATSLLISPFLMAVELYVVFNQVQLYGIPRWCGVVV